MDKKVLGIIGIVLGCIALLGGVILIVNGSDKQENKTEEKSDNKKPGDKKNDSKEDKEVEPKKEEEINDGVLRVPELRGLTIEEAIKKLNEKRITSKYSIKRIDSDQRRDTIVKTEPEVNTPIEGDLEIVFYLSKGVKNFTVENYVGKNVGEVKKSIEAAGIEVIVQEKEYSGDKYEESQIIAQSIKAGVKIGEGDSIILYVPVSELRYPDFTNGSYTEEQVRSFCNEYEIKLDVLYDEPDGTQIPSGNLPKEGRVFYMDKTTKDVVKKGDTLTIKVARY